jgi:hypothetical protein
MVPQEFSSLDPEPASPAALGLEMEFDRELIPCFRAGPRDRLQARVGGHWMAAERVLLDLRWVALADLHPDGHRQLGPGDLELGASLRLPVAEAARRAARAAGRRGPAVGLGWRVKLPNAADEGELGSDETDVALLASAGADLGPLRGWVGGGLAILGDPLMLAAQDDIGFAQAGLGWDGHGSPSPWLPRAELQLGLALASPSNPIRSELGLALGWGEAWRVGGSAWVGLSAASPALRLGLGLSRSFGSPAGSDWPADTR